MSCFQSSHSDARSGSKTLHLKCLLTLHRKPGHLLTISRFHDLLTVRREERGIVCRFQCLVIESPVSGALLGRMLSRDNTSRNHGWSSPDFLRLLRDCSMRSLGLSCSRTLASRPTVSWVFPWWVGFAVVGAVRSRVSGVSFFMQAAPGTLGELDAVLPLVVLRSKISKSTKRGRRFPPIARRQ